MHTSASLTGVSCVPDVSRGACNRSSEKCGEYLHNRACFDAGCSWCGSFFAQEAARQADLGKNYTYARAAPCQPKAACYSTDLYQQLPSCENTYVPPTPVVRVKPEQLESFPRCSPDVQAEAHACGTLSMTECIRSSTCSLCPAPLSAAVTANHSSDVLANPPLPPTCQLLREVSLACVLEDRFVNASQWEEHGGSVLFSVLGFNTQTKCPDHVLYGDSPQPFINQSRFGGDTEYKSASTAHAAQALCDESNAPGRNLMLCLFVLLCCMSPATRSRRVPRSRFFALVRLLPALSPALTSSMRPCASTRPRLACGVRGRNAADHRTTASSWVDWTRWPPTSTRATEPVEA